MVICQAQAISIARLTPHIEAKHEKNTMIRGSRLNQLIGQQDMAARSTAKPSWRDIK
jgi:hypothetical protein